MWARTTTASWGPAIYGIFPDTMNYWEYSIYICECGEPHPGPHMWALSFSTHLELVEIPAEHDMHSHMLDGSWIQK